MIKYSYLPTKERDQAESSTGAEFYYRPIDDQCCGKPIFDEIVYPMVERFDEMFPNMNRRPSNNVSRAETSRRPRPMTVESPEKSTEPLPYAPCPCNSGKKYKFCCKVKGR